MPQVQFDRIDDEAVAICISQGWNLAFNVPGWTRPRGRAEREGREGPEQPQYHRGPGGADEWFL